jgi:hypothetical protein
LSGNTANRRSTRRLESLSKEERAKEKARVYQAASQAFDELVEEIDLITLGNVDVGFLCKSLLIDFVVF